MTKRSNETSYAVGRTTSSIEERGGPLHPYLHGHVSTPWGYVLVYSQTSDKPRSRYSTFHAIVGGREHHLRVPRAVTVRGAAIIAGRWMAELHAREGSHA
jgi:hypothetical protein